jgi:Glycosyl transferase family 11
MVIVQITGGLGNQLFQYAAARSLSLHHNEPLLLEVGSFYRDELPDLEVPRNFELYNFTGINEAIITNEQLKESIKLNSKSLLPKRITSAYKKEIYTEPFYHFDKNFFKAKRKVLLKGGWQSEKYFSPYKDIFKNAFQLKEELISRVQPFGLQLNKQNSVSIHIRRGDYLRKKIILEWHGVMSAQYYKKAFELICAKINEPKFYYFTDDPEWVQKELFPTLGGEIVSGTISQTHFEDLYLMSQCKHNIIANSSFSWWGAWLNNNSDKIVIAPKNWFNKGPKDTQDLYPAGWIQL